VAAKLHSGGANYGFVDGHVKWYPYHMMAGWNAATCQPVAEGYTNEDHRLREWITTWTAW